MIGQMVDYKTKYLKIANSYADVRKSLIKEQKFNPDLKRKRMITSVDGSVPTFHPGVDGSFPTLHPGVGGSAPLVYPDRVRPFSSNDEIYNSSEMMDI